MSSNLLKISAPEADAVELVHWNPRRPRLRGPLRRLPITAPVNNFGDLLGPEIVRAVRHRLGLHEPASRAARLLSVGSVMHLAETDDVVWGTGVNGKIPGEDHTFARLDVRAVRGPLTHAFLRRRSIARHPLPYGDPGLLLPWLWPELRAIPRTRTVAVVPNFHDVPDYRGVEILNTRGPLRRCIEQIAASRLVVGSSLHAIIIAESLGIPARAIRSGAEPDFKYADYYLGTGRRSYRLADSLDHALALGGEEPLSWRPDDLLAAFPEDIWRPVVEIAPAAAA